MWTPQEVEALLTSGAANPLPEPTAKGPLVLDYTGYYIQPDDIDVKNCRHFFDAFGHCETEISARWIVRFCQNRCKGWEPFTYADIEKFYNDDKGFHNFSFNRLVDPGQSFRRGVYIPSGGGWIVRSSADKLSHPTVGIFHFTTTFVNNCHISATPMVSVTFPQLLSEMGITDDSGIDEPVCEQCGGESNEVFVKFMSDRGLRDNEQGDAFAKWLDNKKMTYERFELGDGPMERRKFHIKSKFGIVGLS